MFASCKNMFLVPMCLLANLGIDKNLACVCAPSEMVWKYLEGGPYEDLETFRNEWVDCDPGESALSLSVVSCSGLPVLPLPFGVGSNLMHDPSPPSPFLPSSLRSMAYQTRLLEWFSCFITGQRT